MISGLYPHHHGYLHWDAPVDPALPTLFTVAAAHGYATGSFVFDESYLFKGFPDANVAGTSETLDGAVEWLRAHRSEPFVLWFHSWATHMPYDVRHAERKEWLAAKTQIIDGIQSDSAAALEELREAYAGAVERSSEVLLAGFLAELDALGLREDTALAFLSDHGESWGERFADKQAVQGTYHMHGATLYDEIVEVPLILSAPGRLEPAVVGSQVSLVDLTPTLLDLGGAPLEGVDGSVAAAAPRRLGDRRPAGVDRRHRQGPRLAARAPRAAVEAHGARRVRGGGGLPARPRPARAAKRPRRGAARAARAAVRRARAARAARALGRGRGRGDVAPRRSRLPVAPRPGRRVR